MGMTYSYSALSTYAQCPRKWFESYVNKFKEPQRTYFTVGRICHRVAELSTDFCYRETFFNKARVYLEKDDDFALLAKDYADKDDFLSELFDNKSTFLSGSRFENYAILLWHIDTGVETNEYELVSMPDMNTYNEFFTKAVAEEACDDPIIIEESHGIMRRFYNYADFTTLPHEVMLAEQKLAYTKEWERTGFFSEDAYFRGVVDNTLYSADKRVVVTDYKTSRSMLNKWQVAEDNQLRSYVNMIVHRLGRENVDSVTVRIVYLRFLQTIEYTFDDIDEVLKESKGWIDGMIEGIESRELTEENFKPLRNQYCSMCYIREAGKCPLFERVFDSSDTEEGTESETLNEELCVKLWKESEALKDQYTSNQKACKEFIDKTDGVVLIDDVAILDKHYSETKTYFPLKLASAALKSGAKLADILPFFSITDKNVDKMIEKLKLDIDLEGTFKTGKRSKFGAFTREEL